LPAGSLRHLLQTISVDETAFVVDGVDELWVWLSAVISWPAIVSSEEPMTTGSEHAVIRAVIIANAVIETASLRLVFS
jgi:hypothetical protein